MKLTLGAVAGVVAGISGTLLGQRYLPSLLWWLFSRGDPR